MIFQVAQFELNVVFCYVEPLKKHCLVVVCSSSNTLTKSCLAVCSHDARSSPLNVIPGNTTFRYAFAGRLCSYSCLQPFVYVR